LIRHRAPLHQSGHRVQIPAKRAPRSDTGDGMWGATQTSEEGLRVRIRLPPAKSHERTIRMCQPDELLRIRQAGRIRVRPPAVNFSAFLENPLRQSGLIYRTIGFDGHPADRPSVHLWRGSADCRPSRARPGTEELRPFADGRSMKLIGYQVSAIRSAGMLMGSATNASRPRRRARACRGGAVPRHVQAVRMRDVSATTPAEPRQPARIGPARAPNGALPRPAGDAHAGRSKPQSQGGSQPPSQQWSGVRRS
jgi:hypothetical protein